jgi:hypothetical protein
MALATGQNWRYDVPMTVRVGPVQIWY